MRVVIQKEGDRYIASIAGDPRTKTYDDSPAGALGSLVGFYKSKFGIEQINEQPPVKP